MKISYSLSNICNENISKKANSMVLQESVKNLGKQQISKFHNGGNMAHSIKAIPPETPLSILFKR